MAAFVVDEDLQRRAELFQARDDAGFVQVVHDGADVGGVVADCLVEHLKDLASRFEAHPLQRLLGSGCVG